MTSFPAIKPLPNRLKTEYEHRRPLRGVKKSEKALIVRFSPRNEDLAINEQNNKGASFVTKQGTSTEDKWIQGSYSAKTTRRPVTSIPVGLQSTKKANYISLLKDVHRPRTVGNGGDRCVITPDPGHLETKQYGWKVKLFNGVSTKDQDEPTDIEADKQNSNKSKHHWEKIRTSVVGNGTAYTNFYTFYGTRSLSNNYSNDTEYNMDSLPNIQRNVPTPEFIEGSSEGKGRHPWEDTPKPPSLTISDSEECDTDLELDMDKFLKDEIPNEDKNIGRAIYIRECERWRTAPQRNVLGSLPGLCLNLKNRSLGTRALPPICAALRDNLRVEILNLDGVDITDEGIKHLAGMLLDNISITRLNISNNSLGLRAAQSIGHVMVVTNNITHLNMSGNKLDDNSAWYLTSGITSNSSITHLDLSYNNLGEQAGVLLGAALARNSRLVNLNMSWNKIFGKGSVALFRALMVNSTLETLNVSWNGLGYEGTVALCKCLKRNVCLKDLDVSNNRLNWSCATLMAEGMRFNRILNKLRIGHNPLTTTGVMDILEAIATEKSVVSLLDCSGIPAFKTADLLSATISRRRPFQFLHGGIVNTHDMIGQRVGRELNPMMKIIEYLRLLGLRPLELLKSFNKTSSFEMPREGFAEQIKKIGVKLQPFEIDALANSISGKGFNKNVINYRKLSLAVREVVEAERERKLREREEWLQIKTYHESILKKGSLEDYISHTGSAKLADPLDQLKVNSFQTIGLSGSRHSTVASRAPSVHTSRIAMSTVSLSQSTTPLRSDKKKVRKRRKKKVL